MQQFRTGDVVTIGDNMPCCSIFSSNVLIETGVIGLAHPGELLLVVGNECSDQSFVRVLTCKNRLGYVVTAFLTSIIGSSCLTETLSE